MNNIGNVVSNLIIKVGIVTFSAFVFRAFLAVGEWA